MESHETRFRVATVVSPLCLLSFATSAAAECAWVLWENQMGNDAIYAAQSLPVQRFEKLEYCVNAGKLKEAAAKGKFLYRCLPDTVDPRGPKGE